MTRTINIGGTDVVMKATGSTLRRYKELFGEDLIDKFNKATENLSADCIIMLQNLGYIMARQADDTIPDDVYDWVDTFETFPMDAIKSIADLWKDSINTSVQPKKARPHR